MKNIIKTNFKVILAFILGGLIFGGIGIYAASLSFASGDVDHIKSDGTTTTVEEALNELYAKSESGKVIDLGTGTSFDVSSVTGYRNFTADNFIITAVPASTSKNISYASSNGYASGSSNSSASCSVTKTYNATTGILTANQIIGISVSGTTRSGGSVPFSGSGSGTNSATTAVHVYLVQ